ncbi:MAG: DUF2267 domain-containing protein [Pseudomonadota bacterium]
MTQAYRSTIDHSIQITNEWVHQIDEMVTWEDSNRSFRLLRVTLQAIRDMLGVDEAAQLAAQLPLFIRGVYFEGWDPSGTPVKLRDKPDFIARVCEAFTGDQLDDPEEAVGIIFSFLNTRISAGEINDVRGSLRKSLRDIWPAPHN